MITFKNEVINILPAFKDEDFQPINKKQLFVIYLNLLTYGFVFLLVIIILQLFDVAYVREYIRIIYFSYTLIILLFTLYFMKEFPNRSYLIREKDITFKDGLLTRTIKTIPFARVQHVAINEKVYGRMFGLASLVVYTAGDDSSDLVIHGLELEKANQLKEFINQKVNE